MAFDKFADSLAERFFDAIVTREAVLNVKPDPSHLTAALEAVNVESNEAIVVGDSVVDMRSAKALNVAAVGLGMSNYSVRKLNHAGATHIIESLTDLPALVATLDNKLG